MRGRREVRRPGGGGGRDACSLRSAEDEERVLRVHAHALRLGAELPRAGRALDGTMTSTEKEALSSVVKTP